MYAQPIDEWDFLPTDDETEIEERRAAELAALHVETAAELTPARDPALTDVRLDGRTAPGPRVFFDDEQPEVLTAGRETTGEHEPDLEELLESQHYAFEPEAR